MLRFLFFCLLISQATLCGQELPSFEPDLAWRQKIEALAPDSNRLPIPSLKRILIFSLHTGYEHWCIPHTEALFEILIKKMNHCTSESSYDIRQFEKENLRQYDAIILNNNCSKRDKRDLFWDVLQSVDSLSSEQKELKSKELENNLLEYVNSGGGLMVIHGGITMQNKSEAFGKMVGGSFDYHPRQQKIKVELADPDHPLVSAFQGEGFAVIDEPYFFKNAYFDSDFLPLLYMDASKLEDLREVPKESVKYLSWIKKYGKGRVFYTSLSHNAQNFEKSELLQYFMDGMQYAMGDLICEDSPTEKP